MARSSLSRFSPRRRSGVVIKRFAALFVVLVGVWGVGLFRYADSIPTQGENTRTKTDAIVVLTGGSGRLAEGLKLLKTGKADKLFISGVYKGVDVRTLLEAYRQNPDDLNCCVSVGYAEDTIGNALETAQWVRKNGVKSLRLVTSAYHMPRSILEFEHAMPTIVLVPHPVFPSHVKRRNWWAWPGTADLFIGEYNKFLIAWTRHFLLGFFP